LELELALASRMKDPSILARICQQLAANMLAVVLLLLALVLV